MKIGVFSDTHDNIPNIEKARKVFEAHGVKVALFCGDLVAPFTLKFLHEWDIDIKAVFGNNEGDKWGIKRRFEKYHIKNIEYPDRGLVWELEYDGRKIAVFHGHVSALTESLLNCGKYDVVCTGHTHEPHVKQVKDTLWINPGSVTGISENPEIEGPTVAVYDTISNEVDIINL